MIQTAFKQQLFCYFNPSIIKKQKITHYTKLSALIAGNCFLLFKVVNMWLTKEPWDPLYVFPKCLYSRELEQFWAETCTSWIHFMMRVFLPSSDHTVLKNFWFFKGFVKALWNSNSTGKMPLPSHLPPAHPCGQGHVRYTRWRIVPFCTWQVTVLVTVWGHQFLPKETESEM